MNLKGSVLDLDKVTADDYPVELVSDGYHTFQELYWHRHLLFINFMLERPYDSYISKRHDDGSEWEGWFVAGMDTPAGQITYHLPDELWYLLEGKVEQLPRMERFDGHTSKDVLDRLTEFAEKK